MEWMRVCVPLGLAVVLLLGAAFKLGVRHGRAEQKPCPSTLPVVHTVIKYDEAGRREAAKSLEDQGLIRLSE